MRTALGWQGPPSRRYVKPEVLPGAKGSPASRRCRGAKAGGSGARQGWTNGAGKSAGPGDSSLAGEGGRAAERGTPWHAAQSRLCASPFLPAPLGNGTGWLSGAGWQPGQGPATPHCPEGLGSCPAGQGAPHRGYV